MQKSVATSTPDFPGVSSGSDNFLKRIKQNPKLRFIVLFLAIYGFLLSINTIGAGFKGLESDFSKDLADTISDPISAFCIGLLITGVMQSSSATTSILVALVALPGNDISVGDVIPAVMGANIGTAVTNTIVAFGHVGRKEEFRLAFGGSLVHDIFNITAVAILLPIELIFHPIENMASGMEGAFGHIGGREIASPIKFITEPIITAVKTLIKDTVGHEGVLLILIGGFLLFFCLKLIVSSMRLFMIEFAQKMVDKYLFKGPVHSFLLGMVLTALVQSSSITTSLLVPLQGAGILKIEKVLPFTMGSNIGTTVTAILAALAIGNSAAITLAFAHLSFNLLGGAIIYFLPFPVPRKDGGGIRGVRRDSFIGRIPFLSRIRLVPILRDVPPHLAKRAGDFVTDNKRGFMIMVVGYVIGFIYLMPLAYLILTGAIGLPG